MMKPRMAEINVNPRLTYSIALVGVAIQPHQDSGSLPNEDFAKLIMTALGRRTHIVVVKVEA